MSQIDLHTLIPDPCTLQGKRALVTGGTTGIGRALMKTLVAAGARVMTFGRREDDLETALAAARSPAGEAHGITADISRPGEAARVFAEADRWLGGLDILVNNAAIAGDDFEEQSPDAIDYVVRTNVTGYLACAHEAVRRMRAGGGGRIVLVGSMSADLREEGGSTYVATKGAIQAFAESLRKTVNEDGIRVTLLEPGKVATDMVEMSGPEMEKAISEQKMLRPEEVAGAILFALLQPAHCDVVAIQIRPHLQVI
jgi:NAD(P)-dependent dehydrogenase (short-subunit alcohol dehydrogenase family)